MLNLGLISPIKRHLNLEMPSTRLTTEQMPRGWFKSPTLISMANNPSSSAAKILKKKGGDMLKRLWGIIKRPKSVTGNDLASQSNLTQDFVTSAFGGHDPVLGNDAGSTEPTTSSKHLIDDDLASFQMTKIPLFMVCTVLNAYLADLADLAHHPDPTDPFQSAKLPSSNFPDLSSSAVDQGELQYA